MAPRLSPHVDRPRQPQHRVISPSHNAIDSDPTWVDNPLVDPLRIGCCIGSPMSPIAGASANGGRSSSSGSVNGDIVSPWMEWVESGIEFFGCDENAPHGKRRSVLGRAMMLHHAVRAAVQEEQMMQPEAPKDYASMHDAFLEALLHEQIKLAETNGLKPRVLLHQESTDSSISNVSSDSFGKDKPQQARSKQAMRLNKRRRSSKLISPPRYPKNGTKVAPLVTESDRSNSNSFTKEFTMPLSSSSNHSVDSASVTSNSASTHSSGRPGNISLKAEKVSLQEIADGEHLPPVSWVHPNAQLQKDKGKGDPIGSSICAKGQEAFLEKLRQKIELVVQVAMGEDKKKSAKIKRRTAKITEETDTYTETRSMIELRLGFLSMQYGVLIRWDSQLTHMVTLCVMRKQCHESFYNKSHTPTTPSALLNQCGGSISASGMGPPVVRKLEPPPLVVRNDNGNDAVFQRRLGTEVMLVDPPFQVEPPQEFSPTILTVNINHAIGLSPKSKWTISMTFADRTEVAQLHWNSDTNQFETRRVARMRWELSPPISSFELSGLEIRLYEQRRGIKGGPQHTASMTIPLGGLIAQPSTAEATSWRITIPCSHDQKNSSITLSFIHESDYAYWLYQELNARRRFEVDVGNYDNSLMDEDDVNAPVTKSIVIQAPTDEEDDDLWDWLCGMCQP